MSQQSEVSTEIELYLETIFKPNTGFIRSNAYFQNAPKEVQSLLKGKGDGKGRGYPEMTYPLGPKGYLLLEVKKEFANHSSVAGGFPVGEVQVKIKPKDYAEDGVVWYMQCLAAEVDVIGLAVSGQAGSKLKVSTFRVKHGGHVEKLSDTKVLTFSEYWDLLNALYAPKQTPTEIREFGEWLHNYLRDTMKLSEADKPLLMSAVLVALQDDNFPRHYRDYTEDELPIQVIEAAERVLDERTQSLRARPRGKIEKRQVMLDCFRSVVLKAATKVGLRNVILEIQRNLHNTTQHHHHFDILGHFYAEFLKYSGGDKKGLGIVLTPNHVTSLFSKLADLKYGDAVLDTCTGTAGFLISAMETLLSKAETDAQKNAIRQHALLGIEFNENNYTLACSNMLLRGDGKSNIKHGNCFDPKFNGIKSDAFGVPRVTFLNPPYNQKAESEHELDFIRRACELTQVGGTVIAIVPMSCVCEQSKDVVIKRATLLSKNKLKSVMSMPDGIFPKVGVVTCIMVLTAGVAHTEDDYTWFAYWKDDGFNLKKGVRYEVTPWWDCEQKKPAEIALVSDADLRQRLEDSDGWVYPAGTWQPIAPENMQWITNGKPRTKGGVKVVEGTETRWMLDFKSMKEAPQKCIKVRLFEQAEEMKSDAIADATAAFVEKEKLTPEAAKQKAIAENQHWSAAFIEWCAEAYLETDYTLLDRAFFENALKEYAIAQLRSHHATA